MLLASVKSPPCSSVLYHKGSLNSHGLHTHLLLHSLHAPLLHWSGSCLCVSCNIPVLSSFSYAKVSCFSIHEALCVSSSLFCPLSSSFLSSILSLARSFFLSLRQFVLGVHISKLYWEQVLQGYGGKGGIVNAGKEDGSHPLGPLICRSLPTDLDGWNSCIC